MHRPDLGPGPEPTPQPIGLPWARVYRHVIGGRRRISEHTCVYDAYIHVHIFHNATPSEHAKGIACRRRRGRPSPHGIPFFESCPLMVGYATPSCGPYLGEKSATPVSRGLFATDASCLPGPFDPPLQCLRVMPLMVGYATPSCGPYLGEKVRHPSRAGSSRPVHHVSPPPLTPHFNVVVSFIVTSRSAVALRRHCSTQFNIEMGGEGGARGGAHGS